MKFVLKKGYYRGPVWEFNLPTGWSCPGAKDCLVKVNRETGKFQNSADRYRCYAANAERFPGVREHRWNNWEFVVNGGRPVPPKGARAVRIHASGDFLNQHYFDQWLKTAEEFPQVEFWAYTKSLNYWAERRHSIPHNLVLTASRGGRYDHLIEECGFKNVEVYRRKEDVPPELPIDTNDDYARIPHINFALIDNFQGTA